LEDRFSKSKDENKVNRKELDRMEQQLNDLKEENTTLQS